MIKHRLTPRGETAAERGDVGEATPDRGDVTVDRIDRYDGARSDRGVPVALPSCKTRRRLNSSMNAPLSACTCITSSYRVVSI
jgi:hypothetical protein